MNGEEHLIVHHNKLYKEIKEVISSINADDFKNKISKEKTKTGNSLYSPKELNVEFNRYFDDRNWSESRYSYYITLNRELMEQSILMPTSQQKEFLIKNGEESPIYSYNQTDFVKNKIAVEVQFGKYSFVATCLLNICYFIQGVLLIWG